MPWRLPVVLILMWLGAAMLPLTAWSVETPAAPALFIYAPMEPRATPRDWTLQGASVLLNQALQACERAPSMKTSLGVLAHFEEFYLKPAMRTAMLALDPALFHSIDVAKYEVVMHVRARMPNAKWARRVGSSGEREKAIIEWIKNGRPWDKIPELNPQKILCADDDVTIGVDTDTALADPLANESVNGKPAEKVFVEVTRDFGQAIHPKIVQTEFLSPTTAWSVLKQKFTTRGIRFSGLDAGQPVDTITIGREHFLYAWTAANPEKYNDIYGIEMLEHWGYSKGYVTPDVKDPLGKTDPAKATYKMSDRPDLHPLPRLPPAAGKFAYIADNYRQIYLVHDGKFLSECKYLSRMLIAWEAVAVQRLAPPDQMLPAGWREALHKALTIAANGENGQEAQAFRGQIRGMINQVVEKTHQYHLERVAAELVPLLQRLKPQPGERINLTELDRLNPSLVDELDGLLVAYANVPPNVHEKLMEQLEKRIAAGETSAEFKEIYQSQLFKEIMFVVQDYADAARGHTEAFRQIRSELLKNLSGHLEDTNLDQYLVEVAKGEYTHTRLVRGGKGFQRMKVQVTPDQVLADVRNIASLANLFGWDGKAHAQVVQEYFSQGRASAGLRILQQIDRIYNSARAKVVEVRYPDRAGSVVVHRITPSGFSLGVSLFKLAAKGGDHWGKVTNGRDLFQNLEIMFQPGRSDEEIGQAQFGVLNAVLNVTQQAAPDGIGLAGMRKIRTSLTKVFTLNLVAPLITKGGAAGLDPDLNQELIGAALKDLAVLYCESMGGALILFELGSWGVSQISLGWTEHALITALLENGEWDPPDVAAFKKWKPPEGGLPILKGIRKEAGGSVFPTQTLARLEFTNMVLTVSKKEFNARDQILDLAYGNDAFSADVVLTASRDGINQISGGAVSRFFRLGVLPTNPRKWTKENAEALGLVITRREDSLTPVNPKDFTFDEGRMTIPSQFFAYAHEVGTNNVRMLGLLLVDYWRKQQEVLENQVLTALVKEAGRRWIDKLNKDQADLEGLEHFKLELEKVHEQVKKIDQKLWPRIAAAARPWKKLSYDLKTNTPIFDAWMAESRIEALHKQLQEMVEFLTKQGLANLEATTEVYDTRVKAFRRLDGKTARRECTDVLAALRHTAERYQDGYDQVHASLDEGAGLAKGASFENEPFYLSFEPSTWSVWAVQEGTTPVRGDLYLSHNWVRAYNQQRTVALRAVANKCKGSPPGSYPDFLYRESTRLLDKLLEGTPLQRDPMPTGGSVAHPDWPKLIRLRYQIQALLDLGSYLPNLEMVTPAAVRTVVKAMTITEGQGVKVSDDQLKDAPSRAKWLTETIAAMEKEFERIVQGLTQLFEITVKVDQTRPSLGKRVLASATIKGKTDPKLKLGAHGFPDYVNRFRWTVRDTTGAELQTLETNKATFPTAFFKAALLLVEVAALDAGGNLLSKAESGVAPTPLEFSGTIKMVSGDYHNEPAVIWAAGQIRGTNQPLGKFKFAVDEFRPGDWNGETARAVLITDGREFSSSPVPWAIDLDRGTIVLVDDLELDLPFDVDAAIEITDKAQLPVPGAEVIWQVDGFDKARGKTAALRVLKNRRVSARVEFQPLGLSYVVPSQVYDPTKGKALSLQAELPMLDSGHLTATGTFVPDPALKPAPQLSGGRLVANVGSAEIDHSAQFKVVNAAPLKVDGEFKFEGQATVLDVAKKIYRPKQEPLIKVVSGPTLDLGSIEVEKSGIKIKPLRIRLRDWTDDLVPAARSEVKLGDQPLIRQEEWYVTEYTFTDFDEVVMIEGTYLLPDGQKSTVQHQLLPPSSSSREAQPLDLDLRLPLYLAGNLKLTGTTAFKLAPSGLTLPEQLTLEANPQRVQRIIPAAAPFETVLEVPVQLTEAINLQVSGRSEDLAFLGTAALKAPSLPNQKELAAGVISLSLVDGAAFRRKIQELRQRLSSLQGAVAALQRVATEIINHLKTADGESKKLAALVDGSGAAALAPQVTMAADICAQASSWLQEMEALRTSLVTAAGKAKSTLETAGDWSSAQAVLAEARTQTQNLAEPNRRLEQHGERFSGFASLQSGWPTLQNVSRQAEGVEKAMEQEFSQAAGSARQFDTDRAVALVEKSAIFQEVRTYRNLLNDGNPLALEFAQLSRDLQGAVFPDNPMTGAQGTGTKGTLEIARRKLTELRHTIDGLRKQIEICEKQQPPVSQQAQKAAGLVQETARAWQECRGSLSARLEKKRLEAQEVDKLVMKRRQQATDTGTRIEGLKKRETERVELLKQRISPEDKTRLTKELEEIRKQLKENSTFLSGVQKSIQDQEKKAQELPQEISFLNGWRPGL